MKKKISAVAGISALVLLLFSQPGFTKDWLQTGGGGGSSNPAVRGGYSPSSPQSGTGEPRNFGHMAGKGNKQSREPVETDSSSRRAAEGRNK